MLVNTYPLNELRTNCYLISDNGEAVIVDPADEGGFLAQKVLEKGLKLKYILATHGHFDHLMGLLELKMLTNAPFLMMKEDLITIKRHISTAKHFLKRRVDPLPPPDDFLEDNRGIFFGKTTLKTIHTPGHTPGSVCFYGSVENIIFTGDTIFAHGGVGRTDFSGSSQKRLTESLKIKLLILDGRTTVYPGHEGPTTIEKFKKIFFG